MLDDNIPARNLQTRQKYLSLERILCCEVSNATFRHQREKFKILREIDVKCAYVECLEIKAHHTRD